MTSKNLLANVNKTVIEDLKDPGAEPKTLSSRGLKSYQQAILDAAPAPKRQHKAGPKDWVAFRADSLTHPHADNWVANLPNVGGKDWGYTTDPKQRLLLTEMQAKRFRSYMTKLGKEDRVTIIHLTVAISWRPEMFVDNQWTPNGQRFATEQEARDSASDLFSRWTQPTDYRAMPANDPVNYRREGGKDIRLATCAETV